MVQLQKDLKRIEAAGTQVIGISYDSVDVLAGFAKKEKIAFPLLSDPDSKVIEAFGILNKDGKGIAKGVPHPGTFVIDEKGIIQARLFLNGYKDRHSTEELLKAVMAGN